VLVKLALARILLGIADREDVEKLRDVRAEGASALGCGLVGILLDDDWGSHGIHTHSEEAEAPTPSGLTE